STAYPYIPTRSCSARFKQNTHKIPISKNTDPVTQTPTTCSTKTPGSTFPTPCDSTYSRLVTITPSQATTDVSRPSSSSSVTSSGPECASLSSTSSTHAT